ncbi:ABC transporter permease [Acidisphaera rubrifaciens]|uniref:ABC transporter anion permease n=1 Tax=Acidisphaera rubrifaciens HS-AP3 TaxID=1231350 RepID=A0A0D6P4I8_9PROT|nr:ABC transporter permease subunit [Acidisphaera rubrifaciens]GAN76660.1 ABC transporter anion permease [Acidisphaera rubrifaciens HS-AP3]
MSATTYPAAALGRRLPNAWDIAAILCVVGLLVGLASEARSTFAPISALSHDAISLDPAYLPDYAARTTLRMFAALAFSLLFTFTFATFAAKSRRAGLIMIPLLDILQSVPILGFLTFTVVFFMSLFPGRVMGLELAAIFAIFTSQAWNMAFSLYQSLKTLPPDLVEAADAFRLSPWQRFWRLDVPFAVPGLVWNTMMSMSGAWFFVVASEAVSIGDNTFKLPGIGSYVQVALDAGDIRAVGYAIVAMLVVILAYDQLLFRPLVAWSSKFRFELTAGAITADPWMLRLIRRTRLLRLAGQWVGGLVDQATGLRLALWRRPRASAGPARPSRIGDVVFGIVVVLVVFYAGWQIARFVATPAPKSPPLGWADVLTTLRLGSYTLLRVVILMVAATVIWVPIGVWLGLRPTWARRAQPLAQFLAAFPANLFYPPFVVAILYFHLNTNIWLTPLMVLGTQWYILFNVIAGAAAFPGDLQEAAENFQVGGWLWWRKVMIPGIFAYYVTGAITASGGSWNAAIVAEVVSWKGTQLSAAGLGAYIAQASTDADMKRVVLGVTVMSVYVLLLNRLVWRRLYAYAARRLTFS